MLKHKHSKKRFIVVMIALGISLVAIGKSRALIVDEMQVQLFENLKDVAIQNEITMEKMLNERQDILLNIAEQVQSKHYNLSSSEEIWELVEGLKDYNSIYHFKRMGLITPEGKSYSTDGYVSQLTDEPYLLGMQGKSNISSTLTDAIGEPEPINVFSTPLFSEVDNSVVGILFATYRTEDFKQMLSVDSFGGEGYSYIVKKDGTVITDSVQSPMYGTTNVFDTMLEFSQENAEVIDCLKEEMNSNHSGYNTFYTINERCLHYTPLDVDFLNETWYLYTIVPANVLEDKSNSVLLYQDSLLFVIGVVLTGLVGFFVFTYRKDSVLLRRVAYIDPLTEGYNIQAFNEQLMNMDNAYGYMIAIDINDFKLVNSICGINKGNETIKHIWRLIEEQRAEGELAAHIGGDHYVTFWKWSSKEEVIARIQKLSRTIENLTDELKIIDIYPYFGIYKIDGSDDPEEDYNYANQAKRLAKGNKTKNWAFYEEIDVQRIVDDKVIVDSFKSAIENDEFEVWYQPKYSGNTGELVGAEALVRWRKKDGTLISPGRFIPIFEGNGMIITLDEYVFRKVCMQQKNWEAEGYKLLPISVNISRASLYFGNIVERYKDIINTCKVSPDIVPLEITESATIDNGQIKELVKRFHDVGFPLYLDDFGNGYSSIATLKLIHFDTLKLDKSLVDFIGDEEGEKIVTYTVKLAKNFGMSITAEGVETKTQVEFLNQLNCDEIQGYYFSKPLPLMEFQALM